MKKRLARTLITTIVMSSLVVTPVLAEPGDEAQSIEAQKQAVESQAADVNSQLVGLIVQFDALKQDMSAQQEKITQAEAKLAEAQQKESEQYEAMKLRIQYLYEQGETTFLDTVLDTDDYTDMINQADYSEKLHSYDRKMLKKYAKTKEEVETSKTELEAGQADMEAMAAELGTQQSSLEGTLTDMRSQISDFDAQLAAAQEQAASQLGQLTEDTKNITEAAASQGNASTGTSSKGGQNTPSKGNQNTPAQNNPQPQPQPQPQPSPSRPSNASLGQQIADTACQYIGNPYVYGGNSLTNGIDCSGFVQQIHALFGIGTPRTSDSQLGAGKAISYSDILPGDIIVYSGHVAIYIGGNTIVHASNSQPYPAGGIKMSSPANYRTILGVRRYW